MSQLKQYLYEIRLGDGSTERGLITAADDEDIRSRLGRMFPNGKIINFMESLPTSAINPQKVSCKPSLPDRGSWGNLHAKYDAPVSLSLGAVFVGLLFEAVGIAVIADNSVGTDRMWGLLFMALGGVFLYSPLRNLFRMRYRLELYDHAFLCNGKPLRLDEIKHIDMHWVNTTQRLNFRKVGEAESVSIKITMDGGEKLSIELDESTGFMGWNRSLKKQIEAVRNIYARLSAQTFDSRLKKYLSEYELSKAFHFGSWKLMPPNTFSCGEKAYPCNEYLLALAPGQIFLKKKGVTYNFWKRMFASPPSIPATQDRDILFYVLEKFFGLRDA